jgi:hypothetical protein
MMAEQGFLKKGGKFWLPNLDCVQNSIEDFHAEINKYYTIEAVEDPLLNPLYAATENVEEELLRCPDALTNVTQLRPLLNYSSTPFLVLTRREEPFVPAAAVTPTKAKKPLVNDMTPRRLASAVKRASLSVSPLKQRAVTPTKKAVTATRGRSTTPSKRSPKKETASPSYGIAHEEI